jgi:hypothetical protein
VTDQCKHDVQGGEEQGHGMIYACSKCSMQFIPGDMWDGLVQQFESRAVDIEEAAAGIMARYTRRMADLGVPDEAADTKMYAPEECPGHEGNPCTHCGTSVYLGSS